MLKLQNSSSLFLHVEDVDVTESPPELKKKNKKTRECR